MAEPVEVRLGRAAIRLGAQGAVAMINPRASEEATYQRWKTVWRANALTSCCYVLSVNRPHPEDGVLIGGPSVVLDPIFLDGFETNNTNAWSDTVP